MFIIYVTQLKIKNHIFTKIKNTDGWKRMFLYSYFISQIPNFSHVGFFRECSMFRRSIPLMARNKSCKSSYKSSRINKDQ